MIMIGISTPVYNNFFDTARQMLDSFETIQRVGSSGSQQLQREQLQREQLQARREKGFRSS